MILKTVSLNMSNEITILSNKYDKDDRVETNASTFKDNVIQGLVTPLILSVSMTGTDCLLQINSSFKKKEILFLCTKGNKINFLFKR